MQEYSQEAISQSALDSTDQVQIPPRPEALQILQQEVKNQHPDIDRISQALNKDPSLFGAMLQVVNSPYFGLKTTVTSMNQSVMLLGVSRVTAVVRSVALRSCLNGGKGLNKFWDCSIEVAKLCAALCKLYTEEDIDDAYTLGMLHDAGVPLMLMAFPKYRLVMQRALKDDPLSLIHQELANFGCHRYHIANRLAKKWFLPEYICQAILYQHSIEAVLAGSITVPNRCANLLACLSLATSVSNRYRSYWHLQNETQFADLPSAAKKYFDISDDEFITLRKNLCKDLADDKL